MDIDYHRKNFSLSVLWTIYVKLVRWIAIISIRNILCIFHTFRHCKLLVPFNTGLIEIASLLVELFFHYICHCIPHVLIIVLPNIIADYRQDINKYFYIIGKFLHFNCIFRPHTPSAQSCHIAHTFSALHFPEDNNA